MLKINLTVCCFKDTQMWQKKKSHILFRSVSHPHFANTLTSSFSLNLIHTRERTQTVSFIQMQRGCSLFLRHAVQPGPGLWSAVTSPGTDCKAQCRCDRLPPPRGAPRPWGSAQTGRDHERSRSPRPLYREWWALGRGSLTPSRCCGRKI